MSTENTELLKEISSKLGQLITLFKLSMGDTIRKVKEEIRNDRVSRTILDLADGSLASVQLQQQVVSTTGASIATVKRRINNLVEKGALISRRRRREIYYENSGLYD